MKRDTSKIFSAFGFTQLIMIAAIGAAFYLAYGPWRWGNVRQDLLTKYPSVGRIDGTILERWLQESKTDSTGEGPLVLDVRGDDEFKVSHLPTARSARAGSTPEQMQLLSSPDKRDAELVRPVVIYCSVGYRSAEVADGLKRAGFTRVQMLDGGIFQWANERRALVDFSGGATTKVHPGTSEQAGLLDRSNRASIP